MPQFRAAKHSVIHTVLSVLRHERRRRHRCGTGYVGFGLSNPPSPTALFAFAPRSITQVRGGVQHDRGFRARLGSSWLGNRHGHATTLGGDGRRVVCRAEVAGSRGGARLLALSSSYAVESLFSSGGYYNSTIPGPSSHTTAGGHDGLRQFHDYCLRFSVPLQSHSWGKPWRVAVSDTHGNCDGADVQDNANGRNITEVRRGGRNFTRYASRVAGCPHRVHAEGCSSLPNERCCRNNALRFIWLLQGPRLVAQRLALAAFLRMEEQLLFCAFAVCGLAAPLANIHGETVLDKGLQSGLHPSARFKGCLVDSLGIEGAADVKLPQQLTSVSEQRGQTCAAAMPKNTSAAPQEGKGTAPHRGAANPHRPLVAELCWMVVNLCLRRPPSWVCGWGTAAELLCSCRTGWEAGVHSTIYLLM